VFVFTRNGTDWSQTSSFALDGHFGASLDLSGDTVIVGAPSDDENGTQIRDDTKERNSGSVFIGVLSGKGTRVQEYWLTANDTAAGDEFGRSVALVGDTAVVGAPFDDDNGNNSGSAYVFTRNGTDWSQQAKLTASDGATGDNLGTSVDLVNDTALVGAPKGDVDGDDSGSVYTFTRSGTMWRQSAKLTASDAADGDAFGQAVDVAGDTTVVGAPQDDDEGTDSGSAYVFDLVSEPEERQPPPCPEDLQAQALSNEDIELDWNASADADSYDVYRATGGGAFERVATVPGTSYTDTDTDAGTTYTYEVTASNETGESSDCDRVEVTAIPFFGNPALVALAALGGLGAVAASRARRG
jgi:hypothetical protein